MADGRWRWPIRKPPSAIRHPPSAIRHLVFTRSLQLSVSRAASPPSNEAKENNMFETSTIRAKAIPSRGKYTLLTVSLIAHSAIIIGAITIGLVSVRFPLNAPDEFARAPIFNVVQIPPPLGNPNGGAKPKPQQPPQQKTAVTPPPAQQTAPPATPDAVQPPAQSASTGNDNSTTPSGEGTVPGSIGVPWGTKDSIGNLDAPPAPMPATPVQEKVYTVGEVKSPTIINRIEPQYPPALMRAKVPGKVSVHCIIDKNGRVRDAQVVYATMPAFGESVLRAMKDWRYQPASLNGTAVECYLDLTVDFGVR
jgi:protein TonB